MTKPIIVVFFMLFLSQVVAQKDKAKIDSSLTLISGILATTGEENTFVVTKGSKLKVVFKWQDDDELRDEPYWNFSSDKVAEAKVKKIRIADDSLVELEVTTKVEGNSTLTFKVMGFETFIKLIVVP